MLVQFQFVKFMSFLMVFAYHARHYFQGEAVTGYAGLAVAFFFMASGFLSGYGAGDKIIAFSWREECRYLWGKICRFYPLFFLTTFIAMFYYDGGAFKIFRGTDSAQQTEWFWSLAKNLLLINSWFEDQPMTFNGVTWFLSSLFLLYACRLPVLAGLTRILHLRHGKVWMSGLCIASILGCGIYSYLMVDVFHLRSVYWLYVFPPSHLFDYVMGIACGLLCVTWRNQECQGVFGVCCWTFAELVSVFWWLGVIPWPLTSVGWASRLLIYLLPNVTLLVCFSRSGGLVSRCAKLPVLAELGKFTMPCFLIHQVVCNFFYHFDTIRISLRNPVENYFGWMTILVLTMLLGVPFIGNRTRLTWCVPAVLWVCAIIMPLA